jgi:hypothetical protein
LASALLRSASSEGLTPASPLAHVASCDPYRPASQFNAQYAAAIKAERLDPRSRESWMLYFCCGVSFLCACANGYDGSLMTALIAMAPVRAWPSLAADSSIDPG